MRTANYPNEGFYAFRSKANPNDVPLVVFIEDGLEIKDYYDEITEEEYAEIVKEQEATRRDMLGEFYI